MPTADQGKGKRRCEGAFRKLDEWMDITGSEKAAEATDVHNETSNANN